MLSIKNLNYKIGDRVLFDDVSVTFLEKEVYALSGINGSGKSTFFHILAGDITDYEGTISHKGSISILKQKITDFEMNLNVLDYITQGDVTLWSEMQRRERLYCMEFSDKVGLEMAECEEKISELGGYTVDSRIEKFLNQIGCPEDIASEKMKHVTNAERMKASIIKALISNPDILLLDEPTNGIDIFAVEWIKDFIKHSFKGMVLFISHDIDFVNAIATKVADIDYNTVTVYHGNYYEMIDVKKSIRESLEKESSSIKKKADKLKSFVSKFGAGTRASQAKSKEKQLTKLVEVDLKKSNVVAPYILFDKGECPAANVVNIDSIYKKNDKGTELFHDFSLRVERGDRIAVLGKNGSGKSVLLKTIAGLIPTDKGNISFGNKVKIGYFPQHHEDILMEDVKNLTILEWLSSDLVGTNEEQIRSVLGRMLFTKDDVFKKMRVLSGGETVRCIFAKICLTQANVIVLDDPGNHLDIGSVIALKNAISISTDKTFIIATNSGLHEVCTKLVIFEELNKEPFIHLGKFKDYQMKISKSNKKSLKRNT